VTRDCGPGSVGGGEGQESDRLPTGLEGFKELTPGNHLTPAVDLVRGKIRAFAGSLSSKQVMQRTDLGLWQGGQVARAWLRLSLIMPKGLVQFLGVGLLGLATDVAVLSILEYLGFSAAVARANSLCVATLVTWALNRRLTFDPSSRRPTAEIARYALVTMLAQGLNYLIFLIIIVLWRDLPHAFAAVFGAAFAACFSYTGHRFFSFARAQVHSRPADADQGLNPPGL
jgi:putative flippase GtrA